MASNVSVDDFVHGVVFWVSDKKMSVIDVC